MGSAATYTSAEFENFTRDVAARIIQHYWRKCHAAGPSPTSAEDVQVQSAGNLQGTHGIATKNTLVPAVSSERGVSVAGAIVGKQQVSSCSNPAHIVPHQPAHNQRRVGMDADSLQQSAMKALSTGDGPQSGQNVIGDLNSADPAGSDDQSPAVPALCHQTHPGLVPDLSQGGSSTSPHKAAANTIPEGIGGADSHPRDPHRRSLPHSTAAGLQETPPLAPLKALSLEHKERGATTDHDQQDESCLQGTVGPTTATESCQPGQDADSSVHESPFQLKAGPVASYKPELEPISQAAQSDNSFFNRASNPDSMVSHTSDAGQSITSSIVANIMQGQVDGRLLSTASIDSSVSGRTALQQEGWRARKYHRRAQKDKVPLTSPHLIRKQSSPHRPVITDVAGSVNSPDSTLHPNKRQHRQEARHVPTPSLQNEGWHVLGRSANPEQAAAPSQATTDGRSEVANAGAMPDAFQPSETSSLSAAWPPAIMAAVPQSASDGQVPPSSPTRMPPQEILPAPASTLPWASAAAPPPPPPVSAGQNDKMKDIMAFLDVVEAQVSMIVPSLLPRLGTAIRPVSSWTNLSLHTCQSKRPEACPSEYVSRLLQGLV